MERERRQTLAEKEHYGRKLREMEKDNEGLRTRLMKEKDDLSKAKGTLGDMERKERALVR